jgi:P4 family phage/plasmid primase-like protien
MELPQFESHWNIIPAVRNDKRPVSNWTKYQEVMFPREELDNYNNCNFLAVCGKTSNNLFAIDLDFKKSMSDEQVQKAFYEICEVLDKELGEIANTRVHQTPHGYHILFSADEPIETHHYNNLFVTKKKKTIFTGIINTRFHEYCNGLDVQGEGALIMIPPSEVNERPYRVLNGSAGIRNLTKEETKKVLDFFILEKPKSMRQGFIDIVNGKLDVTELTERYGDGEEHIYWKYLYIEAYHRLGLIPDELFPLMRQNQPHFDEKKTIKQLKKGYHNYAMNKPLTNEKYNKYFRGIDPSSDLGEEIKEIQKESKKKKTKKDKPQSDDLEFDKMSVKQLTDYLSNSVLDNFDIKTLDDSRQIMVKMNNHYAFETNELYGYMKEIFDDFTKGTYLSVKKNAEEMIKDETLFKRKSFCTDSQLINFENGVYDVLNKELITDFDGIFFYSIPHKWVDEPHNCPKFEKAVKEWLYKDGYEQKIIFEDIYEMIGLCMSTHTGFKKSFINIGAKDSGKTQFTNIITVVIGEDNTEAIPLQRMTKDQFGTAWLQMKLLNVAGEIGTQAVKNPEVFKILTGDDFKVPAEIKGGSHFKFKNFATFWFNANDFPLIEEISDIAFFDRFIIIVFPNIFKDTDDNFELQYYEKITSDQNEIYGIIQNAVKGLERLIKRKGFRPEIRQNTRHVWLYESDAIYKFIHDYCDIEKGAKVNKETLYNAFRQKGEKYVTKNSFTMTLQKYGVFVKQVRVDRNERAYHYIGIKLKEGIEFEEDEEYQLDTDGILNYVR